MTVHHDSPWMSLPKPHGWLREDVAVRRLRSSVDKWDDWIWESDCHLDAKGNLTLSTHGWAPAWGRCVPFTTATLKVGVEIDLVDVADDLLRERGWAMWRDDLHGDTNGVECLIDPVSWWLVVAHISAERSAGRATNEALSLLARAARDHGALTHSDLAEATCLSRKAISRILRGSQ